jgi:aminotransferase
VEAQYIEPLIAPLTKAIILLHYGGYPCEMQPIMDLAKKHGLIVIEDSACSPDSWYNFDLACGTIGDFGVWSFDAMKIISTGDGGMIYAKNPEHIQMLRYMTYLGTDEGSGFASGGRL